MDISCIVQNRYTTKAFDPAQKLSEKTISELKALLRLTPSSCNLQPWHFIFVSTPENKEKIAASVTGAFPENKERILKASHVVIFCAKSAIEADYLTQIFDQEEKDGRFRSHESRIRQEKHRQAYVENHADKKNWLKNQVYIALGAFLLEANALGIDACPIGGFSPEIIDESFRLKEKGLNSAVLVSLGHHSAEDYNKNLTKSRLAPDLLFTDL